MEGEGGCGEEGEEEEEEEEEGEGKEEPTLELLGWRREWVW